MSPEPRDSCQLGSASVAVREGLVEHLFLLKKFSTHSPLNQLRIQLHSLSILHCGESLKLL